MKLLKSTVLLILISGTAFPLEMKIKELVRITEHRENQVSGYGLVMGLPGTGDTRTVLARESLSRMLEKRGIPLEEEKFRSRNIAAVYVMAKIPAFARPGDSIDIWVSSVGDARSLSGGFLPQTPLYGADGAIYAVAQGSLAKYDGERNRGSLDQKKNTFRIANAAIIEKQVTQVTFNDDQKEPPKTYLNLTPRIHDLNTNQKILEVINKKGPYRAGITNAGIISVMFPDKAKAHAQAAEIMELSVEVNTPARVVVDSASGTVVMGGNVGISSVAVSKKDLNIQPRIYTFEDKNKKSLAMLPESASVSELVDALNKMGVSVEEIIDILKSIHAAGALQGELIIL